MTQFENKFLMVLKNQKTYTLYFFIHIGYLIKNIYIYIYIIEKLKTTTYPSGFRLVQKKTEQNDLFG